MSAILGQMQFGVHTMKIKGKMIFCSVHSQFDGYVIRSYFVLDLKNIVFLHTLWSFTKLKPINWTLICNFALKEVTSVYSYLIFGLVIEKSKVKKHIQKSRHQNPFSSDICVTLYSIRFSNCEFIPYSHVFQI